ncbi:MAG TPA: lysophospholipid acyltransferase family protein [Burkholderiaceae bacterium]|jgi:1-acyl-sn-glycerol-3-phosphate acyltransferase
MLSSLNRAWRVPATALAFTCFGVGGVLLGLVGFPLQRLLLRDERRRILAARALVHFSFACFIRLLWLLGIISCEIRGRERLDRQGLLILANHPTLIDVVFLVSLVRNADCIVRAGLADNPFTRGPVRATGYICNDGGPELLDAAIASLHAGNNLVIFPEGTRSRPGEPLQMQRGAAQIAMRAPCAVTPVTIRCHPLGLTKGRPWWRCHDRPMHFTIEVGEDVSVAPFLRASAGEPALAARNLTAYLSEYFSDAKGGK